MQNIQAIINRHNKTVLAKNGKINTTSSKGCNCRVKADCTLQGKCLVKSIVYQVTLESSNGPKIYYGSCSTTFKHGFTTTSNRSNIPKNAMQPSYPRPSGKKKKSGLFPKITRQISKQAYAYSSGARSCNLCLEEKLAILTADLRTNINKRAEMFNKCRHSSKFKLSNVT